MDLVVLSCFPGGGYHFITATVYKNACVSAFLPVLYVANLAGKIL